ncbi:hypothetical protein [Streptomyces sp. NPDC005989]|uniref:hypothetical protein n=1 Tax=Streptomyces sp. NPDC005989 TaxID=3156727 RepID=UPI0033C50DF3
MNVKDITEEIELIAEIGDGEDALDLSRRLARQGNTARAVDVRRTVVNGALNRDALRAVADGITQSALPLDWDGFAAQLADAEAGMRAWLTAEAAMPPALRRERSAREWTARQRREEQAEVCAEQVERVNRERDRASNKAEAAAVRAKTCNGCFQVPAVSGECGC